MRLIDADELMGNIFFIEDEEGFMTAVVAKEDIENAPTADVTPVLHGRWEENELGYMCSSCNKLHITGTSIRTLNFKFCPYCGAKMDKEATDGLDTH